MTDVKELTTSHANGSLTTDPVKEAADIQIPANELPALYRWPTTNERGYSIAEEPSGPTKALKIIAVGAGASGINLAKFTQDQLKNVELVIYEKNHDVGGTWFENKYPYVTPIASDNLTGIC
jgi:NADH dehydrogenase FAD-containing subunit